jgi:hypothetical protein
VMGGVALWTWVVYFYYKGTVGKHLLPGFVFQFVTLPSSLLMEWIAELMPWILSSPIIIMSIMTGLGAIQVVAVWLVAMRLKFQRNINYVGALILIAMSGQIR